MAPVILEHRLYQLRVLILFCLGFCFVLVEAFMEIEDKITE